MIEEYKEAVKALENAFKEREDAFRLREKAREKEKNVDIEKNIEELVDKYSFDFEDYRVLKSFMIGLKEEEIEKLYLGQRVVGREDKPTKEGFKGIVDQLIANGWLIRRNGKVEVDYDFIDCLGEVDRE